jgi:hypothetical protein
MGAPKTSRRLFMVVVRAVTPLLAFPLLALPSSGAWARGFHELLMDRDEFRTPLLARVRSFFSALSR